MARPFFRVTGPSDAITATRMASSATIGHARIARASEWDTWANGFASTIRRERRPTEPGLRHLPPALT